MTLSNFPTNYVKLIKKEVVVPKPEKKKKSVEPPPLAPRKTRTPTPPPPITPKSVLLEARYSYTASQKDELSFKKGDIIKLLTKNTGQGDAWWKGELRNSNKKSKGEPKQGIFPSNYVKKFKKS